MLPPMDLDLTLGCGQVFRWFKHGEWWSGVLDGAEVMLRQGPRGIDVRGEVPEGRLCSYFRSEDDLDLIYRELAVDQLMTVLTSEYGGMRLIRQDPWECCLSYLLATNANFPRIQTMVETVCTTFGRRLPGGRHAFPQPSDILESEEKALRCGLGYRCPRMVRLARDAEEGELDLDRLIGRDYETSIEYLKRFSGIGDKVADCVALFSLDHLNAFPVDVRIRRVMEDVYGVKGSYRKTRGWGQRYFGRYAGYAQELLYRWGGTR